ncbi:hypothetical protein BWR18_02355 [Tateyamaria omphalii]|uniref:Uncharacterized protein n=1 Tax=Tateyamaria omphalii TaxID=299262 RepID=A0A1P8MRJ1_9RHOB|nr:hypothetical protein BWR18_02355 [Tateyamaria omphalii]
MLEATAVKSRKTPAWDIQQRRHGLCQYIIDFSKRAHDIIKAAMLERFGQTKSENLQQPAHLMR